MGDSILSKLVKKADCLQRDICSSKMTKVPAKNRVILKGWSWSKVKNRTGNWADLGQTCPFQVSEQLTLILAVESLHFSSLKGKLPAAWL